MKTVGYLVSTLSVVLLGIVSFKSCKDDPWLMAALVGGMITSVTGMACRWLSHRRDKHNRARIDWSAPSRARRAFASRA
jgi:hypothetical protein